MKKYITSLFITLLLIPNSLLAYSVMTGTESLRLENNTTDNLYAAGGNVDIIGNVNGDLILAGGNLNIQGEILDNAIVAGGNIQFSGIIRNDLIVTGGDIKIRGPVLGDIRAFGDNITLAQSASGDVNIGGGDIQIGSGITLGKDLSVFGESLILNAIVQRNTDIRVDSLDIDGTIMGNTTLEIRDSKNTHIGPNAKIMGTLTYKAPERITNLESIAQGGATYAGAPEHLNQREGITPWYEFLTLYILYRLLFLLIVGGLLIYVFPRKIAETADTLRIVPGKSFLFGILYFILMPFLALILFITIIGIPLGFLVLCIYIFSFVFAKLLTLVILYELIIRIWSTKITETWQKIFLFFLLALLLSIISGIDSIAIFFALGALILTIHRSFSPKKDLPVVV